MKKLVSAIVAASMLISSSVAFADNRDPRWGVDSNRNSPYHGRSYDGYRERRDYRHDHGVDTGTAVAIGLGALLFGAIISNNNSQPQYVNPQYRQPQQVCQDIVKYDYYGNPYIAGRNCWYQ